MDYSLSQEPDNSCGFERNVLILILMDYSLSDKDNKDEFTAQVLILILMDYSLSMLNQQQKVLLNLS